MKKHQYYKQSTPTELNNIFLNSPYIVARWKQVYRLHYFLEKVLHWNNKKDDEQKQGYSSISYKTLSNIISWDYALFINELESLGLLQVRRYARKQFTNGDDDKGECYSYKLTEKCLLALACDFKSYFYNLLNDKKEIRRKQKRISYSKYNKKSYGDTRDNLKEFIDNVEFDYTTISNITDGYPARQQAVVYSLLTMIENKSYKDLNYNKADSRVWTPYLQLPVELKKVIKLRGMSLQSILDIRSCYPTIFGYYIITNSSPYLGTAKSDILKKEVSKWNDIFLNESINPKEYVSTYANIPLDHVKEVMIAAFNGKHFYKPIGNYKKFYNWLKSEFPEMYALWITTDIKQTGCDIGKLFETKLMLDDSIYKKAKELNICAGYEYDGLSLYAKDSSNIATLLEFIRQRSLDLLGFRLIFANKLNSSVIGIMAQGRLVELDLAIKSLKIKLQRQIQKCFSKYSIDNRYQWTLYNEINSQYEKLVNEQMQLTNI